MDLGCRRCTCAPLFVVKDVTSREGVAVSCVRTGALCSRTGTHSFTPTQARALPPTHGTCTATFTSTNTNSMFNFLPTPRAPITSFVSHSTLLLLWQASHTVQLQDTHAQGLPLLSHTSFNRTRAFLLRQYPIFSIPPYQPPPPSLPSAPDEPKAACPTHIRQLSTDLEIWM